MTNATHPSTQTSGATRSRRALAFLAMSVLAVTLLLSACSGGTSNGAGSPDPADTAPRGSAAGPYDQALAYAECMRKNGIAEFPDPDSNGGFEIKVERGSSLDRSNPQYQAAEEACESLKPDGPGPGEDGGNREANLKYSQCMRENGIEEFPDPDSNGNLRITGGPDSEINQENPEFQAAQEACKELRAG